MMDDVWAVDHQSGVSATGGADILEAVGASWARAGLEEHEGKRCVDQANAEIQGMVIHADDHWLGLSIIKRWEFWQSGMLLLTCWRPPRRACERLLGKLVYAMGARTCCRSLFGESYKWLKAARGQHRAVMTRDPLVYDEFHSALALLP